MPHDLLLHRRGPYQPGITQPTVVCSPIAAYDRAFQARLAAEIERLPPGAALEQAMLDYADLRDQARACAARP